MSVVPTTVPASSRNAIDRASGVSFIQKQCRPAFSKTNSMPAPSASEVRPISPRARCAGVDATSTSKRWAPARSSARGSGASAAVAKAADASRAAAVRRGSLEDFTHPLGERERLREIAVKYVEVPHLAARARGFLAVQMQLDGGVSEQGLPVRAAVVPAVAEDVDHHHRRPQPRVAEWQAAERTHLLLELVGDAGVERVVAGVVRARGDLVDQELAADDKELNRHHADVAELVGNGARHVASLGSDLVGDAGGDDGDVEDAVFMAVLGDREHDAFAGVAAGEHDRHLALELDEAFQHAGLAAEFAERRARFLARVDPRLALAVVAEARHFQQRGRAGVG